MPLTNKHFLTEVQKFISPEDCHIDNHVSATAANNTLGFKPSIIGIVFPRDTNQLTRLVSLAKAHQIGIHTVSQGKNVGYGDMTPAQANQLIINLSFLNQILDYDPRGGTIVVQPGVTQQQLSDFLIGQGGEFWADMTGASPSSSIIGNTIDGGFGHTPLGNHRKHILSVEVLLENGQILKTLEMPATGPDLSQLFVQTNFGIVLSMRIPLLRAPEKALTYTVSLNSDESLGAAIEIFRKLQLSGVVESLVHIGNSTRTLMTSTAFPSEISREVTIDEQHARRILKDRLGLDPGAWTAVGCLYGFKSEVKEKARFLEAAFRDCGKVRFVTDQKLNLVSWILNLKILANFKRVAMIRRSVDSLRAIHGLMRGRPSSVPIDNILWRTTTSESCGLIWHAPVVSNSKEDMHRLLLASRTTFAKFGFEMPLTLTLINPRKAIAVFNINFDRSRSNETERAQTAYKELGEQCRKMGFSSYRYSILGQPVVTENVPHEKLLNGLKKLFDPDCILAPGRYGLGTTAEPEPKRS